MTIPKIKTGAESATPSSRLRGRPRAFDRNVALDRAMVTFWHHGYEGASMPLLTREMGISAQSLYSTFISKAALYREALEHYRQKVNFAARAYAEEDDIWTAFRRVLSEAAEQFTQVGRPSGCMLSIGMLQFADEHLSLAESVQEMRAGALRATETRIRKGQRAGQLIPGTDAKALARLLYATVLGMAVQARDGATRKELRQVAGIAFAGLEYLRPTATPQ